MTRSTAPLRSPRRTAASTGRPSTKPIYLGKVDVNLRGAQANGQPVWTAFVANINYNAKGQRTLIQYGNGAATTYEYDAKTFRLTRLKTTRAAGQNGLAAQIFKRSRHGAGFALRL